MNKKELVSDQIEAMKRPLTTQKLVISCFVVCFEIVVVLINTAYLIKIENKIKDMVYYIFIDYRMFGTEIDGLSLGK